MNILALLALAAPSTGLLIQILIVTLIAGIIFMAALKYLELPQPFKGIILFVIILIWALWLFSALP